MHNWHGPYCLVHKLTQVRFELRTQTNKLLNTPVHVNRMKPFVDSTNRPLDEPGLPPDNHDVPVFLNLQKNEIPDDSLHPQHYQHPLSVLPLPIKHSTPLPVLPPHPPLQ